MPTPAYRVPVRVARGTKAALDAGLADLQEGEICYATDENTLYSVEGGVLTSTKSSVDLADIELVNDLTPQLGGNLDTNGFDIVSLSGAVDIGSANGELVVRGGSSEGKLTLNCTANTHGVSIQSPPHSSSATYTLTLPDDTGTDGQALTTDGSGSLSWATPSTVGSIDDLSDVDTTTVSPTDGQALVWDNANSEWIPGNVAADIGSTSIDALADVDTTTTAPTNDQVLAWDGANWVPADQTGGGAGGVTSIIAGTGISVDQATGDVTVTATGGGGGGGAVDSVNGETGVVSLGIQDMDDFGLFPGPGPTYDLVTSAGFSPGPGDVEQQGSASFVNSVDKNGIDWDSSYSDPNLYAPGVSVTVYVNDVQVADTTLSTANYTPGRGVIVTTDSAWTIDLLVGDEIRFDIIGFAADVPLVQDDILKWNNTAQKFQPAQLPAGGGALDDLSDVDYSAGTLDITDLNNIRFGGNGVPADTIRQVFANAQYGTGLNASNATTNKGSFIYTHETDGILLKAETSEIIRLAGDEAQTDNTPELRWESGSNAGGDATGNYVGLKLAAGQSEDVTYTLPLGGAVGGQYLQTDGSGQLSWSAPIDFGSPLFAVTSGIVLNYEEDGTDTPLDLSNGPAAMSTDAQVGTKSIRFNVNQADGEYITGTYPSSPYGNVNYLGTSAFTFQTWFKNLNPELPGNLTRYHRMWSGAGGSNQENEFQIRTNGSSVGTQGAWQLYHNADILTGSTAVTDANWHHLAIQHDGYGAYRMFLDGVLDGTAVLASPINFQDGTGFIVGGRGDFGADTFYQGHLDATEIIVGVELYSTAGFTPPTTPAGRTIVLQERTQIEIASIGQLADVDTDATPPTDGQALVWVEADQEWQPGTVSGGGGGSIFGLSDVEKTPIAGTTVFFYDGGGCNVPTGNGSAWPNGAVRTNASTGLLSFADFDADGEDFRSVVAAKVTAVGTPFPFWTSADGATNWTQHSSSGDPTTNSNRLDFTDTGFTDCSRPIYVTLEDPANETPVEDLLEGDVLAWSNAEQKFRPAQPSDATATRALLGIGEYVDDATAGTGGVTSGAMYYNTTSSDYRLKS